LEGQQTADTFGFRWHRGGTFGGETAIRRNEESLLERGADFALVGWSGDHG
jgi:hypothetical protein